MLNLDYFLWKQLFGLKSDKTNSGYFLLMNET